ncbi:NUDIX hydrolase [Deinococcus sonorensis]|uniref:NUDIX hydrolase n=2 Tax=Deinococcus sonorensis TaxID=309891 RepID=A0AAU7UAU1_9DEIO
MGIQKFPSMQLARACAARDRRREKALCFVVQGERLLVFDHVGVPDAGVQLPAGGVEPGESPAEAAVRELWEESGLRLSAPVHLLSYEWRRQLPERLTHQVCHAFAFRAPDGLPETWTHPADGEVFQYRWAPLDRPALDWDMDTALPALWHHLQESV